MKLKQLFSFLLFISCCIPAMGTTYYINARTGKNTNKGTGTAVPFQTVAAVNSLRLVPGDSVLFASGQTFTGMLQIKNTRGLRNRPIVISNYAFSGNKAKPVIDAGDALNALFLLNASHVVIKGIEFTGTMPVAAANISKRGAMRCGILVEVTTDDVYENIALTDVLVHDVYYNPPGFVRSAAETKSANGTQNYGWGIRFINNTRNGKLNTVTVQAATIYKVSHTGLKATATPNGITALEVANCKVYNTGGPGMQFSGVSGGHIHHNTVDHSGSTADSRNWGRGSGLWTWTCANILIEQNRFENANGPGDSAGVHIDFNCRDVVVQYNVSANNAGGFCEILGNNFNCAYRYNISVNDGYRVKGVNGAFQEGKIVWLSGYQGNQKKSSGPYNSYFYNNTVYVAKNITPRVAVSSSTDGVLIANNIFYFENDAELVAGDQQKAEVDVAGIPGVVFKNNLFLRANSWPAKAPFRDENPIYGNPIFSKEGGLSIADYLPANKSMVQNKGVLLAPIRGDTIGLKVGLNVQKDILGNAIVGQPDLGAIELPKVNSSAPNVILIVTDDQGYADVGFNGSIDIPTPNIDRIAKNGVTFSRGYVSYAVCAPSRAGLLTGRYQDRFGFSRNPLYRPFDTTIGLPLTEETVASFLQQAGYTTMAIGKWHLGAHQQFRPQNRGFHNFFGFLGGGHSYFPAEFTVAHQDSAKNEAQSYKTKLVKNGAVVEETEYLTDALSREAVTFIAENGERPFFLYLAYNAPHGPLQATPDYLARFNHIKDNKRKTYAAMVSAVDDGVGRVLNKLEEQKLAKNTIVIFLSDNGGPEADNGSDNGPLRAGKSSLYEGGIRVPFAMQWPRHIKPGTRFDSPVISLDLFATIADNVTTEQKPKNKLDGVNLLPYLNGTKSGAPHDYLFWRNYDQKNYAVIHRSGMKEVILRDTSVQVYNLHADVGEVTNIQNQQSQWLQKLENERRKWEANTVAPVFLGLLQEELYNKLKKEQKL